MNYRVKNFDNEKLFKWRSLWDTKPKKEMIKYIITIILLAIASCQSSNKSIGGLYRCDNDGKSYALELNSCDSGVMRSIIIRKRYTDVFEWTKNDDIIYFSNIDTNYFYFDDSKILVTIPTKALYSKEHILFYMDSTFMVFYKVKKDEGYKGEFYYTLKQVSGEETKTIRKLFGDSLTIINKLQHDRE